MTLDVFRDPASVTVVGASADPGKWGWWLARGALRGEHRRAVHLVGRGGEVAGRRTARSLDELPGELDLVALCVPAAGLPGVVDRALDRGARGFIGITSGLPVEDQARLAARIRGGGARLVGPNCLGVFDAASDLQLAWGHFRSGRLAIVTQSGQVGSELADLAAERGLGVSRFVSLGNQADVSAAEVLSDLADHEATSVVALYLEDFGDGRAVVDAIRQLSEAGTPTLVLTVGESAAGRGAAASHTGALTSSLDVVDAASRAAGAVRVETPRQLVDAAHLLATAARPRGPRVAVVGDSGGQVALAADVLTRRGVTVEPLSPAVQDRLRHLLPAGAATANPVDLAGAGEADLGRYADVVEAVATDVDSVVLTGYFGGYAVHAPSLREAELAVAGRVAATCSRATVVVHAMAPGSEALTLLEDGGVPTYATIDAVATALSVQAQVHDPRPVTRPVSAGTAPRGGYLAARAWLSDVDFPPAVVAGSREEVAAAARTLRAPYVLKADWIAHKTEHDAVRPGLPDLASLLTAHEEMATRLGPGPWVVEELDTRVGVVEMIVGARRDPAFGPVVLVGAGGVLAELVRDTALELAPVDHATARAMLGRLQVLPLLQGHRGHPPLDVEGLVDLVVAVSEAMATAPADVSEIELNPVRVGQDSVLAVDALVVSTEEGAP